MNMHSTLSGIVQHSGALTRLGLLVALVVGAVIDPGHPTGQTAPATGNWAVPGPAAASAALVAASAAPAAAPDAPVAPSVAAAGWAGAVSAAVTVAQEKAASLRAAREALRAASASAATEADCPKVVARALEEAARGEARPTG